MRPSTPGRHTGQRQFTFANFCHQAQSHRRGNRRHRTRGSWHWHLRTTPIVGRSTWQHARHRHPMDSGTIPQGRSPSVRQTGRTGTPRNQSHSNGALPGPGSRTSRTGWWRTSSKRANNWSYHRVSRATRGTTTWARSSGLFKTRRVNMASNVEATRRNNRVLRTSGRSYPRDTGTRRVVSVTQWCDRQRPSNRMTNRIGRSGKSGTRVRTRSI